MFKFPTNRFRMWNGVHLKTLRRLGAEGGTLFNPLQCLVRHQSNSDDNQGGGNKYRIFKDEDASIILDVEEERAQLTQIQPTLETTNKFEGLDMRRGVTGVFDIDDLVAVLTRDSASDIVVLRLPASLKYVDWLVVATGKSRRHLCGTAQLVRQAYKRRRLSTDPVPKIEGDSSSDWIALDLGNIALHLMLSSVRKKYDIESLWSLGSEYDTKCNEKEDEILHLLNKYRINLDDFQPANNIGK